MQAGSKRCPTSNRVSGKPAGSSRQDKKLQCSLADSLPSQSQAASRGKHALAAKEHASSQTERAAQQPHTSSRNKQKDLPLVEASALASLEKSAAGAGNGLRSNKSKSKSSAAADGKVLGKKVGQHQAAALLTSNAHGPDSIAAAPKAVAASNAKSKRSLPTAAADASRGRKRHSPSKKDSHGQEPVAANAEEVPTVAAPAGISAQTNRPPNARQEATAPGSLDAAAPPSTGAMGTGLMPAASQMDCKAPGSSKQEALAKQSSNAQAPLDASLAKPPSRIRASRDAKHRLKPPASSSKAESKPAEAGKPGSSSKSVRPGTPVRGLDKAGLQQPASGSPAPTAQAETKKASSGTRASKGQPSLQQSWKSKGKQEPAAASPSGAVDQQAVEHISQPEPAAAPRTATPKDTPMQDLPRQLHPKQRPHAKPHRKASGPAKHDVASRPAAVHTAPAHPSSRHTPATHSMQPPDDPVGPLRAHSESADPSDAPEIADASSPHADAHQRSANAAVPEDLPEIGVQLPVADWVVSYLRERLLDPAGAASSQMALRPALQRLQVSDAC